MPTERMGQRKRAVLDLFEGTPSPRLTTQEVAEAVYGPAIKAWHLSAMRRLLPKLGFVRCRVGQAGGLGWKNVWGRPA